MLGKLFGRRKSVGIDTDDAPTAKAPVRMPRAPKALPEKSAQGFDPYNSGAFKRKNAWEKVPRL